MRSRDFCYWAQGFFEVTEAGFDSPAEVTLTAKQVQCFKNHLAMVFRHEIDPSMGDADHQAALSEAHQGGASGTPPKPMQEQHSGPPWQDPKDIRYRC